MMEEVFGGACFQGFHFIMVEEGWNYANPFKAS